MSDSNEKKLGTKGVFAFKCPRCGRGDLFIKPFKLSEAFKMPERCAVCDQDYWPEPGFYYGAMFIGYIVTAFFFVIMSLILVFGFGLSVNMSMFIVFLIGAATFVYFFRLARSLWIHIAIRPGKE